MAKISKDKILTLVSSFLPGRIVSTQHGRDWDRARGFELLDVSLLYADISGFTAMSEKLASLGKEGAEEVNKLINGFFDPMIKTIFKYNGDIYRFGGDSILSFFSAVKNENSALLTLHTAAEIAAYVKKHRIVKTRIGKFKISIHMAIVCGKIYFQDLGSDYMLAGASANRIMALIDRAGPGEIIVDNAVRKSAAPHAAFTPTKEAWKLSHMKERQLSLQKKKEAPRRSLDALKKYIPDWLYRRILLKPHFDKKDGEHRKATVLFMHFSGISFDANPIKAASYAKNFYAVVKDIIARYDGWLNSIDVYKDSARIMAVFGFPVAHEDEEKRAILFASEVMNHGKIAAFKPKAGINAGSVFIAPLGSEERLEYAVMGDTVNLAARFAAKSQDNEIVVSETVFNKTYTSFEYESLGAREFKGKKQKILSFRMIKKKEIAHAALGRWLSESKTLVGRNAEVETINKSIAALSQGKGQAVVISGEAGIGKSRLLRELLKALDKKGITILKGDCLSYGSAFSYHPWVAILNTIFKIGPEESSRERARKIRTELRDINPKLIDWLPVVGEIMGVSFPETTLTKYLDPKVKKQRVFDIIFDLLCHYSSRQPVAVVIEDLHWADTVSLELINYIVRNIENRPIIVSLTYRPMRKREEFSTKKYTSSIMLKELTREDCLELVQSMLNIKDIPRNISNALVDKAQGNPFYLEELVKSLIEQGHIMEKEGSWVFAETARSLQLPDTVEAVILSRIDRLDLIDREILQVASVIGREFADFMLAGVYPDQPSIERSISNLQHLDFIREEREKKHYRYTFKHIMTREVAYNTLSYARRRELHRDIGMFLETKFKDRLEEFLGHLSYHFYSGEDYEKSLQYSVEAGEKAKKVYANDEAIEFFTRAIESYEKLEKPSQK